MTDDQYQDLRTRLARIEALLEPLAQQGFGFGPTRKAAPKKATQWPDFSPDDRALVAAAWRTGAPGIPAARVLKAHGPLFPRLAAQMPRLLAAIEWYCGSMRAPSPEHFVRQVDRWLAVAAAEPWDREAMIAALR